MVGKRNLSDYIGALENLRKKNEESASSRSVKLFFAFDIVNSSGYKDMNYFGWPIVLTKLLKKMQNEIAKDIPESQFWRVLGDEIVFFVPIKDLEEIYNNINSIFEVLYRFSSSLKSGDFFEELNKEPECQDKNLIRNPGNISLKAASWIAIVNDDKQLNIEKYDNILVTYDLKDKDMKKIYEFLGQDIDTGFRIKQETQERRLVVSVELAYLLSERTEYLSRLHIITYKDLKGVWQNSLYPIIWYHDSNIYNGITFEDSFYYDETTYSKLSKEYFSNREKEEGDLASYMFEDVNRALHKIMLDKNIKKKIEKIKSVIKDTNKDERLLEKTSEQNLLEMHCAVVCCDVENRKVLIAKRTQRKYFNGLWEFGCAKASIEFDLVDSLEQEYFEDFGIRIKLVCDKTRNDTEPIPIALYQLNKVDKKQKGVITVAKIIDGQDRIEEYIREHDKHSDIYWISQEEVEDFNEAAVEDFKNTLKTVFAQWDVFFKEKNDYE